MFKNIEKSVDNINELMMLKETRKQFKIDTAYLLFQEAGNTILGRNGS